MLELIKRVARNHPRVIVFPEASHPEVKQAVELITLGGWAIPLALTPEKITASSKLDEFGHAYAELARKRGEIALPDARELIQDPFYFAALMVRQGYAHGLVGGLTISSHDILSIFLNVIGVREEAGVASEIGFVTQGNRTLAFADVAVNPDPSPKQLAYITRDSCQTYELITGKPARAALVSYSTGDSGKGHLVDKIHETLGLFEQRYADPNWTVFGPCQVDSALDTEVARTKGGPFTDEPANILIGGNLDVANSLYKLAQSLWETKEGRQANKIVLPQGLKYPAVDISRGATARDIVNSAAALCLITEEREIDPYFVP